ncbi:hypothetical protein Hypma_010885 [Hypsizygus marmoreus]|uniref:F-box domain-containing protein n=1 Tax=Hypsizygus marmoreus TaxID=39966 RepID=A0A369JN67_HYPMA|nr:hypothetical protein Hypma_010885 [Hypsizygus marmoreus]
MFDHTQIPLDVFVAVFEIGTLTWGVRYLPPLCIVCRAWNDIILSNPRLWGIVTVTKDSTGEDLETHIAKAKASPLTIFIRSPSQKKALQRAIGALIGLSHNWVSADVPVQLLTRCRWPNLRGTLESLRLSGSSRISDSNVDAFFAPEQDQSTFSAPPRLRSLAVDGVHKAWITPLLSSSITYLELNLRDSNIQTQQLSDTLDYLTRASEVVILKLNNVQHYSHSLASHHPVCLPKLLTLGVDRVLYPSTLLSQISAPSLQTLTIRGQAELLWKYLSQPELNFLGPFFAQWSQGIFLPTQLHTLELVDCLQVSDVALLIRWLARLPSLVRLILIDDSIARARELRSSSEETNILAALASPEGAGPVVGGWLCPMLMQFCFSTDFQVTDLIPLARARGGVATPSLTTVIRPGRLRVIEAPLCPSGTTEDIRVLANLMDQVRCTCVECQFHRIL